MPWRIPRALPALHPRGPHVRPGAYPGRVGARRRGRRDVAAARVRRRPHRCQDLHRLPGGAARARGSVPLGQRSAPMLIIDITDSEGASGDCYLTHSLADLDA